MQSFDMNDDLINQYINFAKKSSKYQILPETYGGGSKKILYMDNGHHIVFKNWIDGV